MTPQRKQISLRRIVVAFAVMAGIFAYYGSLPFYAMKIGWFVGIPAFFIIVLIRRDQIRSVVRCYIYAALVALLASGASPFDIWPTAWGGVIGWALAVIQNQSIRSRKIVEVSNSMNVDGAAREK